MNVPQKLSRRERQIMRIVYELNGATVNDVHERMADAPTKMAVRRTMHILEEKGHLRRREGGRAVTYLPVRSRRIAGMQALRDVLETFFEGSLEQALAAHFSKSRHLSDDDRARLQKVIDQVQESNE